MKFVGDLRAFHASEGRKPRHTSLECSNLGVMDGGAGPWTIDQAFFSQSALLNGPAVSINSIAVTINVVIDLRRTLLNEPQRCAGAPTFCENKRKPIIWEGG